MLDMSERDMLAVLKEVLYGLVRRWVDGLAGHWRCSGMGVGVGVGVSLMRERNVGHELKDSVEVALLSIESESGTKSLELGRR